MEDQDTKVTPNLDMANEKDRGLLRRAAAGFGSHRKRWDIPDRIKEKVVRCLERAMDLAENIDDPKDATNALTSCGKTIAMLEGQNQADDHLVLRIEQGERVRVDVAAASPLERLDADPQVIAALSDAAARRGLLGLEVVPVDPKAAVALAVNGAGVGGNGNGHANGSNGNGKH